jgi:phenylacetate-CoA ligase
MSKFELPSNRQITAATTDIAFKSVDEITQYQKTLLNETLQYIGTNSTFYKRLLGGKQHINSIDDLKNFPVTTKLDLQQYSKDFICVPKEKIIDYVTTSGTLGDPVTFALTDSDLNRLAYNEAQSFTTAGCTSSDIIQLMTTIDRRFMAGLAYFMGARALGCGIVRVGNGIPELQWDSIRRVKPTTCIVVPSFLLKLIDFAVANGIDYRNSSLRRAICIGESLRNDDFSLGTLGSQISEKWQSLQLYSTYASTEMQTSITECSCFNGGHVPPELLFTEFLDENNNPVADGEAGEVTITTFGVEGMPLLRFKTGDICYHHSERCACGRNTVRLSPVLGRKGEMIKYKGTTLYPPALYDILDNIPEIKNYIVEVYTNRIGTDEVLVRISSDNTSDSLQKKIKDLFRSKVRVAPEVVFEHEEIIAHIQMPAMSRKVRKFVDLR